MRRITTTKSNKPTLSDWTTPPPFVMNRELSRPSAEARLFAEWPHLSRDPLRLSTDEEVRLFKQLHYCAWRMRQVYRAAEKQCTRARRREFNEWAMRYERIRSHLTETNLGLVYDLIGRTRYRMLERDDLRGEGLMALLRAIDTFDPWRGYRFSTYACNAILRAFSRVAVKDSLRRSRMTASFDTEFDLDTSVQARREEHDRFLAERLRNILANNEASLSEHERLVLERRFPSDENARRETLDDIGRLMQVSKERVRQIQLAAVSKLRAVLMAEPALQ